MDGLSIIRSVYRAFGEGDMPTLFGHFDASIEWQLAEHHVYLPAGGGPFRGTRELGEQFFARLAPQWQEFIVSPARFHVAGETVIVEGRYTGTHASTHGKLDAQFCHLWTLRNGKVIRFQQYMDTAQLREAATLYGNA
jgi:ketosteroid isomerase-like protein